MRRLLVFCLVTAAAIACRAENAKPEINLLDGKELAAWEFVTATPTEVTTVCQLNADGVLAVIGKPVGFVATKKAYKNYRLRAEWRWPAEAAKNSNGGILLHIASGPKDRAWPLCFQLQTKPTRVGDLLPMAGASFAEKLSTAEGAKTPQLDRKADNSEKPLGEWNACDIVCRDGAIEVSINGVAQNKVTQAAPAEGKIGFQLEGTPFEMRNVRLTVEE